ncbi:MAG: alanine--glyoxylate aminotransferase family protein [Candidatus Nezhaarchaeota archaeon]|nr:alanine--glyoxylate aminotransferase family protein [Candidatus Nezhaarchaeota archaeon]MCX8141321.1 alanine--glyoxylate aminotransferase family protein [Candidatus Nezhaarchaeota archaeon]MDW8049587.1 alanine--glyoxylate aminotransferase family protein [Nitrososphaerota archaeon]
MGAGSHIDSTKPEDRGSSQAPSDLVTEKIMFFTPGPTYVHPRVLRALSRPVEPHSYSGFIYKYRVVLDKLKRLFKSRGEVFLFAGSGTLAQEVMVTNSIRSGDRVLCLVTGFFSSRFKDMVERIGGIPKVVEKLDGRGFRGKDVEKLLKRGGFKAITVAHVDTSTGVTSYIDEIGEVASKHGVHLLVDAVASLGAMDVRCDEWGITICGSCTQKGIGAPPGCTLIAVSKQFVEELEARDYRIPIFYGDLKGWLSVVRNPENYYSTQPISLVYALNEALDMIFEEGLENRFKRHEVIAKAIRAAVRAAGLKTFAKRGYEANTVTVIIKPDGLDDVKLRSEMEKLGITIARGSGPFKQATFRIGHMGWLMPSDVMAMISSLELTLRKMNFKPRRSMTRGAMRIFESSTSHHWTSALAHETKT